MLKGIDISKYQRFEDDYYETLNQQQLSFVFIKASEGIYKDPRFAFHSEKIAKTCLLKGAYHFLRFKTPAQEQADTFLQAVTKAGFTDLDLPPVLDVEDIDETVDVAKAIAAVDEWLKLVKQALNVEPIIYTGGWYWRDANHMADTDKFKGYKLWTSRYAKTYLPMYGGWVKPTFWQYSETGELPGHNGHVDLDYFFDDVDTLWNMTTSKKLIISPNTAVPKIFAVQTVLMHLGHYSGQIDGKCGTKTLKALNDWSTKNNLPAVVDSITPTHWKYLFNLDITSAPVVAPVVTKPTVTPIVENIPNKSSGVVAANLLNIRQGPDATRPMVALPLPKGKQVNIVDEENGWLKVNVNIQGWVKKSLVQQ